MFGFISQFNVQLDKSALMMVILLFEIVFVENKIKLSGFKCNPFT